MQIRKCQTWSSWECSEVANLDPEKFRNISVPFTGETDDDFLQYIESNRWELQDISDELDENTIKELQKLWEPEWIEYANSTWKGEESWLESGKVNEEWVKTGGFEATNTTLNY